MKKIVALSLILMLIVVSGCGSEDTVQEAKKVLEIETIDIHTEDTTAYITKNEKVQGSSEIVLTSQVNGRVKSLVKNIGDTVVPTSLLVQLQDTSLTAYSNVKDAQLALQRAQLAEQTAKADIELQKKQLQYNLNNLDGSVSGSNTQLQLAQLENQLIQAELDYGNTQTTLGQNAKQFVTNLKTIKNDLTTLLSDVYTETDKIFGLTDLYDDDYTTFNAYNNMRVYIEGVNKDLYKKLEGSFFTIEQTFNTIKEIDSNDITEDTAVEYSSQLQTLFSDLNYHFSILQEVFTYLGTVEDYSIRQQVLSAKGVITPLQGKFSSFQASSLGQLNSMETYFLSYNDNQTILLKKIDTLRSQIALTKKQLDDAVFTTTLGSERSEIGFDSQLKNSNLTSQSARLGVEKATNYQSKFSVTSPIEGSLVDVMVDIGQDVAAGTPLVKIISQQQQIETSLTIDQLKFVKVGQKVDIISSVGSAEGTVLTIADAADTNGLGFKVIVGLTNSTIPTGLSVEIKIPVQEGNLLLPLNALNIVDTNTAIAYFWDNANKTIVKQIVTIQAILGQYVEITDMIPMEYSLIVSDISNFNKDLMNISLSGQIYSLN
ncbi:hypothetical protein XF24_00222 [candidate division SR1 bacterium Aalborg_AAW-1]|nr:hypothetical protein XF24_00222 [candidate division SR1 bacterium Aalborg_AAW-1]